MHLNYSKIRSGKIEQPVLRLQTLAGKNLGAIPFAYNVKFDIRYSDVSELSFEVPYMNDGRINPLYAALSSYKIIYTDDFGIYVLASPQKMGDGVSEVKTVRGYSLEKLFEKKRLYLEEGTYDFWNPVHPSDTILGRIIETDTTWRAGYVDPKFIGCYRLFDEYDSDPLTFCYGHAAEKYQCAIVFDVYDKTINVYDASKSRGTLPIYLSYENLVDTVGVDELTEEITTKLHVYGADGLDIRGVNPTGDDCLIDLSYFIANGDLDIKVGNSAETLAEKVRAWESLIRAQRQSYTGLVAVRASKTARRIAAEVELKELENELETLVIQQSVTIQALAIENTAAGRDAQELILNTLNNNIANKRTEITGKQGEIASIKSEIDLYTADIKNVNDRLAFVNYFTENEQKILNHYLIEGDVTEETFVATDVEASVPGISTDISGFEISISDSYIEESAVTPSASAIARVYMITGGKLSIGDEISADIQRGTLDIGAPTSSITRYTASLYLGATTYRGKTFPSGMLVVSGDRGQISSDVAFVVEESGEAFRKGTRLSVDDAGAGKMFFTVNVNEYQRYSVAQELYDFGKEILSDAAHPVYEFQLKSGNFLFQKEFEPFKNRLELGKAVHLDLGSDGKLNANIIGLSINFETPSDFTLTFSNCFRLKDLASQWASKIEAASSSSRSFDASKYIYNRAANKTTQVSQFMEGQLEAAVNTIIGAQNQSVVIDGAGVHIGGDSQYQIRIVDSMIAMSADGFQTAKIGIGHFASPDPNGGTVWGVNAEMLAGKLIIGNTMVLENPTNDGTMMFKVDASGAWLYNSTMVMQKQNGGRMIFDPKYGIVAGNEYLFDTNGTTVTPGFLDAQGDITLDEEKMPQNANFFLDIRDGNAYFRGKVLAKSGQIGGFTIADNYLHTGEGRNYVALNGSQTNEQSTYAIWAGAAAPENAPFWVKKNGDFKAASGTFSGTLTAAKISGSLTAAPGDSNNGWLEGCGIKVGANSAAANGYNFYVDKNGNVWMNGSINMSGGSIVWGDSKPVSVLYARLGWTAPPPGTSYTTFPDTNRSGWHKVFDSGEDVYVTYSYDGGDTWTETAQLVGRDGSDADVNAENVFSVLTNNGTRFGIFSDSGTSLYINATYIRTGTLSTEYLELCDTFGGFCKGRGYAAGTEQQGETYGAMMYGGYGQGGTTKAWRKANGPYVIVTNRGCRMQVQGGEAYVASSDEIPQGSSSFSFSAVVTSPWQTGSDRRIKTDIDYGIDKYADFFMSLKPAYYRMKDGASGRYHTGFIAQDVEQSLSESGLDNSDFAGLAIERRTGDAAEGGNIENLYTLRYSEFISLNTYMIQKLHRRIEELENKIEKMG